MSNGTLQRETEVSVEVATDAARPRVWIQGREIGLRKPTGKPFSGKDTRRLVGTSIPLKLKMREPRGTDWKIVVKFDGDEVYKETGTTDRVKYEFNDRIDWPAST